jgi:hypothetical protein
VALRVLHDDDGDRRFVTDSAGARLAHGSGQRSFLLPAVASQNGQKGRI